MNDGGVRAGLARSAAVWQAAGGVNGMKFIGITGGVGAGKSTILAYLRKNYRVRTLVADEAAHEIMEPGYDCYVRLQKEFAQEKIWLHNGRFNRQRLAEIIFADEEKRERLNSIVHPAVKEYILKEVEKERRSGSTDYVVLEAALLIEDGYDKICDELWYVYVTEENRRKRLIENRGYSDEKIEQMFAAQLSEGEYRRHCQVIIDNNGPVSQVYLQLAQLLNDKGDRKMQRVLGQEEDTQKKMEYVFGLDIGTRNVVGTVGYKEEKEFIVVAQYATEHETRAMLDGQIHDIGRVGRTISIIKEKLEDQIGQELTEVCIAAAGRVLKTVTTEVDYEFPEETVVTGEHIHTLELLGIDKAAQQLKEANDTKYKFYCVGYSVMKYFINDEIFSNIESHKADKISAKIIVTFLPEDVVDGLYMAVGFAGLTVANMTLEPIAAIDVAIPENFRMLNIALVDVGAGTSDISLTRDGSIIAYGMIPFAGDELTEMIVQHYLVDFKMAEHIKLSAATDTEIEFEDIMSLKHTITAEEVWKLTEPLVDKMSTDVAEKIKELNGDQSVSATFIVGGGGKIHGFDEMLAKKLELPQERVALRGAEVLKEVTFLQDEIVKDPLLVTPIGICLNYYEQKNNFIMVRFNGERMKLYDNNKLTIVDAAIQAGFPNDQLFPKRGKEINFTVNGRPRIVRGDAGEAAIIRMNDRPASINTPIEPNCDITIEPSTAGREAHYMVGQLEEYHSSTITFEVNGKLITCPRYVEVNGILEPPTYEIKEDDAIVTRSFYTVEQLAEFMDVELDMDADILVNNRVEDLQALVYENFSVDWKVISYRSTSQDVYPDAPPKRVPNLEEKVPMKKAIGQSSILALPQNPSGADAAKEQAGMPQAQPGRTPAVQGMQVPPAASADSPGRTDMAKAAQAAGAAAVRQAPVTDVFGKTFTDLAAVADANRSVRAQRAGSRDSAGVAGTGGPGSTAPAAELSGSAAAEAGTSGSAAGSGMSGSTAAAETGTSGLAVPSSGASGSAVSMAKTGISGGAAADEKGKSGQAAPSAATGVSGGASAETGASGGVPAATGATGSVSAEAGTPGSAASMAESGKSGSAVAGETGTPGQAAPSSELGAAGGASAEAGTPGSAASMAGTGKSGSSTAAETGKPGLAVPSSGASGSIVPMAESGVSGSAVAGETGTPARAASEASKAAVPAGTSSVQPGYATAVSSGMPSGNAAAMPARTPQEKADLAEIPEGTKSMEPQAADIPQESTQAAELPDGEQPFQITVNGETITLKNKKEFIFVDIFEYIQFDLSQSKGRMLKTEVNGQAAQYTQLLNRGDKIDIYWKENR